MPRSQQQRREQILSEIRQMDRLRRGFLSEQYFEHKLPSGQTHRQGPYYVLQRQHDGRKISKRIPADQAEQVRQDIAAYERFVELSREWADLTEAMTVEADTQDSKKKPSKS